MSQERLNKLLALRLGISRREADDLIAAQKVSINDSVATLGARVTDDDRITVDGAPLPHSAEYVYLAFHKPVGYVCSRKSQDESPTIYTLLPEKYHALKPVGRLDKDSSGLILLTNDGDFAYRMTHPKFHKTKSYEVTLDRELAPLHQQMINDHGVQLVDGGSKLTLERLSDTNRKEWTVLMHEGRNRQIRRTFGALGYTTTHLHRTRFATYELGSLESGQFQELPVPSS